MRSLFFFLILACLVLLPSTGLAQLSSEELLQKAALESERWQQRRLEAERMAELLGLPIRTVVEGRVKELQFFLDGMPMYYITYNLDAATTTSTNLLWGVDYNLSGQGETLGIWDGGGVRTTHQEFGIRVVQKDDPGGFSGHATHVAGTMISAGLYDPSRGMAGNAGLKAYDWNNDLSEMYTEADAGLRVSNHSYGYVSGWFYVSDPGIWRWYGHHEETESRYYGLYENTSKEWDALAYDAPYYLIVKAAGNDRGYGPSSQPIHHEVYIDGQWVSDSSTIRQVGGGTDGFDCLPRNSVAKNILALGAVMDVDGGYVQSSDVVMTSFSSWGPTDDGRIKPDLVANGYGLLSTHSDADNAYATSSGTSMAAPNLAGTVGLLLELYRSLHGHDSVLSSTMKALLLHSADVAGDGPGPDYVFGWGLMNARRAADILIEDASLDGEFLVREGRLDSGKSLMYSFYASGLEDVKATLVWTDPPGTPPASSLNPPDLMLVNDLDMRLHNTAKSTYQPYVLDPANPSVPATTGDNYRDNVEQILVSQPTEGEYFTVEISHKGILTDGFQNFSLVLTGVIPSATFAGVSDNWDDPNNWSDNANMDYVLLPTGLEIYPVISSSVSLLRLAIENGARLTVASGGSLTARDKLLNFSGQEGLLLKSDAQSTASLIHTGVDVEAAVERYIEAANWEDDAEGWHFLSSPVQGQSISQGGWITEGVGNGYDFYAWQEAPPGTWLNQKVSANNIENFNTGKGYLVSYQQSATKSFSGLLHSGTQAVKLSNSASKSWNYQAGWNLLGNPFPSAIDWSRADHDPGSSPFEDVFAYIYDSNNMEGGLPSPGYVVVDGSAPDAFIPAHQGFFVRAKDSAGGTSFTFTNHLRVHGTSFIKQQTDDSQLSIRLAGNGYVDQTRIRILEGSSSNRDHLDALKMFSFNENVPQLYSLTQDHEEVAINSLPSIGRQFSIPLGVLIPSRGEYSLSIQRVSGEFAAHSIFLKDRLMSLLIPMGPGQSHSFTASSMGDPLRFELLIVRGGTTTDYGENVLLPEYKMWHHGNILYVEDLSHQSLINIYDITGRTLQTHSLEPGSHELSLNLNPGIYLVRITGNAKTEGMTIVIP